MRPPMVVGLCALAVVAVMTAAAPAFADEAVPDVVGLQAEAAKQKLVAAGFRYVLERVPGHETNKVVAQAPPGGSRREKGTAIYVRVGAGTPAAPTPEAKPDAGKPPPPSPEPKPRPERWRLADRNGPPLPSAIGLLQAEATKTLKKWRVRIEETVGIPDLEGRVVAQAPPPGQPLAEGESVVLVIARTTLPPTSRVMPRVVGQKVSAAREVLGAHGFQTQVRWVDVPPARAGEVYAQQPLPGSMLEKGGAAHLAVGAPTATQSAPEPKPGPTPEARPTLDAPMLISPSEGQRYPRDYETTFRWKPVAGAEAYEWVLERAESSERWKRVDRRTVPSPGLRAPRRAQGRYRWRVRAARATVRGAWSPWFRLFFQ